MIHSFMHGRIRLKDKIFRDKKILEAVLAILHKRSNIINNVEANPLIGSILLEYTPDKIPHTALKPLVPFLLKLQNTARGYTPAKQEKVLAMLKEFDSLLSAIEETLPKV